CTLHNPGHLTCEHHSLSSAIKRHGRAVSPPSQRSATSQDDGTELDVTSTLGTPRHQDGGTAGRGAVTS
ncbi:MAG: hypothetical protein ACK56F_10945, partial [bacterium]